MRRRFFLAAGAMLAMGGCAGRPAIPAVPSGEERLEQRYSRARGRSVDFWTAVPAGHGDGRGLPVCLILHGGSKRPTDFSTLGLGRYLTDCVRRGAAPFVLAGATGDRLAWRPRGGDDPQWMVHEEMPAWCAERGFDTGRMAAWGWSMGGSGALLLASTFPGFLRSVAAFSPAVAPGDVVFDNLAKLGRTPVGLWCGKDDDLHDNVRELWASMPVTPRVGGFGPGQHNFDYWATLVPDAFDFVAATLR